MTLAFLLLWSTVASFVGFLAVVRAHTRPRRLPPAGAVISPGKVVLVRPCAGPEPLLDETLRSSVAVARVVPGARVVMAVASRHDGAFAAAVRAQRWLQAEGVAAAVVETRVTTANAKSGQVAAVLAGEACDVVLVADSDVLLGEDEVRGLLAGLADGRIGASWVPPAEVGPVQTLGDRVSQALLCGSLHSFPLLAGIDPGGMVGKLFAVRRRALDAVGGFEALGDVLGEDMELGRLLAAGGWGVVATGGVGRSLACQRTLGGVLGRYARWLQVIRAQRPALLPTYPLLFFPTFLVLALAAVVAPAHRGGAILAAGLMLLSRLAVGATARRLARGRWSGLTLVVDLMLADLLLLGSFVKALVQRTVVWRGRSLAVEEGGRLRLVAARAASVALPLALAILLGISTALALPKPGQPGKNVRLEDADGKVIEMETMLGKPILILYEDKDSATLNQAFKDELGKLAKGDKYKDAVALAAVADLTSYNYWPVKGFVKDAIRKESRKIGTTIFCDWDAHVRGAYGFTKGTSSVVLIDRAGKVLFAAEGQLGAESRKTVIALLRAQVEG
jgi:ceramide glucosyltransferase